MSPVPGQPVAVEKTGRSKVKIALLGCGGVLALCLILGIVGALVSGGDDDGDEVASAPTATAQAASTSTAEEDETPTSGSSDASAPTTTSSSEQSETPTVAATATETAAPEPTETPEPEPTPTTAAVGTGRSNPVPFGEVGQAGDWEIQILEVVRGEAAFNRLLEENQFNSPPPPGMEYVLVNARVKYNGSETEAQNVDYSWFHGTGDARVKWDWPSVVRPTPELDVELFSGAEASGWTVVLARQGEGNLLAIFEPFLSTEEGDEVFLALEPGANVPQLTERLADQNDLGFDRMNPVALGEHIVGDTWEIWVIESIRGEEALARIKEANQFNADPDPGMEYVLVRVGVRNVKPDSGSDNIDEFAFKITGDAGRVYDSPVIVDPEPALDYDVYAGGEVDGWITMQVAAGEQNLKLVYEPPFSFTADPRYLSIQ